MAGRPSSEQWLAVYLPLWPLASDDLREGIYRMSTPDALRRRFIEANPQQISNLLVVDIDHEDAALRAMWARQDWLPNAVVENPVNGHAHAVWALQEPVTNIVEAVKRTLERAEPELAADLVDNGITMAGGSSMLRGLTTVIANATGLDTRLAEDPLTCVARGTSVYLENLELWKDTMESDHDEM